MHFYNPEIHVDADPNAEYLLLYAVNGLEALRIWLPDADLTPTQLKIRREQVEIVQAQCLPLYQELINEHPHLSSDLYK